MSGGEAKTNGRSQRREIDYFLSRWREVLGAEVDDVEPVEALEGGVDYFGPMQGAPEGVTMPTSGTLKVGSHLGMRGLMEDLTEGVIYLGGRWAISESVRQMGAKTEGNNRRSGSGRT